MTNPDPASDTPLLIAGASARAAAASAVRSGVKSVCFDLFGDADLRAIADVVVVRNLRQRLITAMQRREASRWMYTGALENHPRVVEAISRRHRLLGNPAEVLRAVRDPFRVAEMLRNAGLDSLDVRAGNDPPPRDGTWVIKPIRSAAGRGMAVWDESPQSSTLREPHYFQERFIGAAIAAVFLASRLSCRLLGITRQLVGETDLHAKPFAYCGSIGPLPLTPPLREQVERTGQCLAEECRLQGLFGIDLLMDRSRVMPTEVNPRYPASAEVLEYATGLPVVRLHCLACESFEADSTILADVEREIADGVDAARPLAEHSIVGKAILFSDSDIVVPQLPFASRNFTALPSLADVPQEGSHISRGDPVCTVFAGGTHVVECLNALLAAARNTNTQMRPCV